MQKCVQNGSSNGGYDAVLEGALNGGLNIGFEGVPRTSLWKQLKMYNEMTKRIHLTVYLVTSALKYKHASAFLGIHDGLSEGTPKFEIEIKGAVDVITELHLIKLHMMMLLLV